MTARRGDWAVIVDRGPLARPRYVARRTRPLGAMRLRDESAIDDPAVARWAAETFVEFRRLRIIEGGRR